MEACCGGAACSAGQPALRGSTHKWRMCAPRAHTHTHIAHAHAHTHTPRIMAHWPLKGYRGRCGVGSRVGAAALCSLFDAYSQKGIGGRANWRKGGAIDSTWENLPGPNYQAAHTYARAPCMRAEVMARGWSTHKWRMCTPRTNTPHTHRTSAPCMRAEVMARGVMTKSADTYR